jgi:predicted nucleic acid-binding protein
MTDWVFVDTCIWATFFRKPNSPEHRAVSALLRLDRVALVGPILAEVLLGIRRREQADWVASRLKLAHYIEAAWDDWRSAAELGRQLAAGGNQVPLSDLLLGVIARNLDASVYSTDPHFDLIPDLKRFWP